MDKIIKIKNYKCFGDEPQGFDKIYPINVIIGKNNSGKSSLIDLISFCTTPNDSLLSSKRKGQQTKVYFDHTISEGDNIVGYGRAIDKNLRDKLNDISLEMEIEDAGIQLKFSKSILKSSKEITRDIKPLIDHLISNIPLPLQGRNFRSVTAERDIKMEGGSNQIALDNNGNGATSMVQLILNNDKYDARIINDVLLNALNQILNPEIKFTDIITKNNTEKGVWEIYLEDEEHGYIPLSKMGSGIKTVLLVLLNMLVLPMVEKRNESTYIFAFEELENNLHPALLRRLFLYTIHYCEEKKALFFITTHSNIVIDIFGNYENAQILHVTDRGDQSICNVVNTHFQSKNILRDLDIRASDLLQSNGIIWVEGPSDRIYINKWLSLLTPVYKEGVHYSILFYGGKLLSNLTFNPEWLENEFIPLLKVNHNAFVIIDRDGKDETVEINATKQRIQTEIGEGNCWITEGREIENYLSNNTLSKWLKIKKDKDVTIKNDKNTKLEKTIKPVVEGIEYEKNKKGYASEISEYIELADMNVLDLFNNLTFLMQALKTWNP